MLMFTGACLCSFLCRNGPVKITSSENDPKKNLDTWVNIHLAAHGEQYHASLL